MLNMDKIQSDFKLLGSRILTLSIENHLFYSDEETNEEYKLKISQPKISHHKEDSVYFGTILIIIQINITSNEDSQESVIDFVLEGGFTAPDKIGEESFTKLLKLNGASMLYSIARAKIEAITAAMFSYGNISIPVVNIFQYYEEEKKNLSDQSKEKDNVEQKRED